eukprot:GHUV01001683.1.p1 GENE.GHUV01001683.1~~GHUV01001683.1.p1  ORF type:complete len:2173 (+),score=325.19 GHUV01001683.1:401-6520(+)
MEDAHTAVIDSVGTGFDHNGILAHVRYTTLGLIPPPPAFTPGAVGPKRIKHLTEAQKTTAASAITEASTQRWQGLLAKTDRIMTGEVYPHWRLLEGQNADQPMRLLHITNRPAREVIEELGSEILLGLQDDMEIARALWSQSTARKDGSSHLHMCNRGPTRRRKKLLQQRKVIAMLLHQLRRGTTHSTDIKSPPKATHAEVEARVTNYLAQNKDACQDGNDEQLQEQALLHVRQEINKEKAQIEKEHPRWCQQQEKKKQNHLMLNNQKLAGRIATGRHKATPRIALRALKAAQNTITTDGKEIIDIIEAYESQARSAPEPNGKTGRYLPQDAPRDYPFDNYMHMDYKEDFQSYQELLHRTAPPGQRTWLHACIDDDINFSHCLKSLKHGKTPGPDGVVNELLQVLPKEGKSVLHNMMRIMWATGLTPQSWKDSNTVLLYKNKGTPLELKYFRRIGLELTIYKLWTKLVTYSMVHYAETRKMLSNSQAGFRSKRTTTEQIEMMVSVLEDAFLTKQDVYLLQADLTEAFDTISHDKLLMILYDLGYPTDAVEVVKDLYSGARTKIQTPHGPTRELIIDRGTIQGDSLSPFLFVLYLEPLLRWLREGQRGYKAGSLAPQGREVQEKYRVSNITFADDINLLTNNRTDMLHQAEKLTRYANWGHLGINPTKTTITAALHKTQPAKPYDETLLEQQLSNIKVQGQNITYHPPRKPFRHLGVLLTMDLNYKHQLEATLVTVRQMITELRHSLLGTAHKTRIIESTIRPSITYALSIVPYTKAEMRSLDALMARATKQAYKLATSMPTAAAHMPKELGGLGCHSLEVEQTVISIQRLRAALEHPGPLGVLSQALFEIQKQGINMLTATMVPSALRYSMRIRQLLAYQRCGYRLCKGGIPQDHLDTLSPLSATIEAVTKESDNWSKRMVEDLNLLHSLGIRHIEQMLDAKREVVRPVQDLKLEIGARIVKGKHKKAWNRLTHYLHTGQVYQQSGSTTEDNLPMHKRIINPQTKASLQAEWPENPTAKTKTLLHFLSGIPASNQRGQQATQHTISKVLQTMTSMNAPKPVANLRSTEAIVQQRTHRYPTRQKSFQERYRLLAKAQAEAQAAGTGKDLAEINGQLLGLHEECSTSPDQITAVSGHARVGLCTKPGSKRPAGARQDVYISTWRPQVLHRYTAAVNQLLQYRVAADREATEADMQTCKFAYNCEQCKQRIESTADVSECSLCGGKAHSSCLEETPSDRQYTCEVCKRLQNSNRLEELAQRQTDMQLIYVEWEEAEEVEETVLRSGTEEAKAQLLHIKQQKQLQSALSNTVKKPRQHDTPALLHDTDTLYDITIGEQLRKKFIPHTQSINPHLDITPTYKLELTMRFTPYLDHQTGKVSTKAISALHDTNGHCTHMFDTKPVARLYSAFKFMKAHKADKLRRCADTDSFIQALKQAALRYTDGTCAAGTNHYKIQDRHQYSMPTEAYDLLCSEEPGGFKCTTDRFASPFNVHQQMHEYWTPHHGDRALGASYDSYSVRWTGSSVAMPDFEPYAAAKALEWAIKSAATASEPTVTVLLLPNYGRDGGNTAYMPTVQSHPHLCKHLITIPASLVNLQPPANMPCARPQQLKWNMLMIAVGNASGFCRYCPYWDHEWLRSFHLRMGEVFPVGSSAKGITHHDRELLQGPRPDPSKDADISKHQQWLTRSLRRFRKLPADHKRSTILPGITERMGPWEYPGEEDAHEANYREIVQLLSLQPEDYTMAYEAEDFIYTDGSALTEAGKSDGPGIGAAVCILPKDILYDTSYDTETIHIPIDCKLPGNDENANTINRAELAAIAVALEYTLTNEPPSQDQINIATDSLGCIRQIQRVITRPQDLKTHRHYSLLKYIAGLIDQSRYPVHLWKVKSHIGILGNELADRTAVSVAKGTCQQEIKQFPQASNNRHDCYWPCQEKKLLSDEHQDTPPQTSQQPQQTTRHTQQVQTEADTQQQGGTKVYVPIANIEDQVKADALVLCHEGSANLETIYVQAWKSIRSQLNHKYSHIFLKCKQVSSYTRKLCLQAR